MGKKEPQQQRGEAATRKPTAKYAKKAADDADDADSQSCIRAIRGIRGFFRILHGPQNVPAWIAVCVLVLMALVSVTRAQQKVNGDWRWYGGDAAGTKYSPLDQINAENVNQLQIVWRWKREGFGPRPD